MKEFESEGKEPKPNITLVYQEILQRYPFLHNTEEKQFQSTAGEIIASSLSEYHSIDQMMQALHNPHAGIRIKEELSQEELNELRPTYQITDEILYLTIPDWHGLLKGIDTDLINICRSNSDAYTGIIVDVRKNHGGDSRLAHNFAGIFFKHDIEYGTSVQRKEGRLTVTPEIMKSNREFHIEKPLVLLTSPICFSSNELYLAPHKISGRAMLIGERTRGGSAVSYFLPLIIDNYEYAVSIPTRRLYLKGAYKPLEETAILPDIPYQGTDIFAFATNYMKSLPSEKLPQ